MVQHTLNCLLICVVFCSFDHSFSHEAYQLNILSINQFIETDSRSSIIETIHYTQADIICVQESNYFTLKSIASDLGYYCYHFPKSSINLYPYDTGILSRFPIAKTTKYYVIIEVAPKEKIAIFNVHLNPIPFELNWLKRDPKRAEEAKYSSIEHRLPKIIQILSERQKLVDHNIPCFIVGDFNEPSHLDWGNPNNPAVNQKIDWPVSSVLYHSGLTDTYRYCHANQHYFPGYTWPSNDIKLWTQDRIDFMYHNHKYFEVNQSYTLGSDSRFSDVCLKAYNSDHRAVFATYERKRL